MNKIHIWHILSHLSLEKECSNTVWEDDHIACKWYSIDNDPIEVVSVNLY